MQNRESSAGKDGVCTAAISGDPFIHYDLGIPNPQGGKHEVFRRISMRQFVDRSSKKSNHPDRVHTFLVIFTQTVFLCLALEGSKSLKRRGLVLFVNFREVGERGITAFGNCQRSFDQ